MSYSHFFSMYDVYLGSLRVIYSFEIQVKGSDSSFCTCARIAWEVESNAGLTEIRSYFRESLFCNIDSRLNTPGGAIDNGFGLRLKQYRCVQQGLSWRLLVKFTDASLATTAFFVTA